MSSADASYWGVKQMELSDGIITTQEYLKAKIQKLAPRKKVHIIPNCIDLDKLKPRDKKKEKT